MLNVGSDFGRTIQLFLVDGIPNGLAIASIRGWTGSVMVGTQTTFDRLRARPEADRTGVYILFGPDQSDVFSMRAYIGEADSVRDRINNSAANHDFWETAVVITSSDSSLTKGHVRYLEARMIQMARDAGRVSLDNGQEPDSERRRLPEADKADMEAFLSNLLAILPVVGLDLFKPRPRQIGVQGGIPRTLDVNRVEGQVEGGSISKFKISGDRVMATAFVVDEEFTVLKGSKSLQSGAYTEAIRSENANLMRVGYARLKKFLMDENVLVPSDSGLVFSRDFQFKSPSAASSVVLDRNSNGRTEWVEEKTNLTYHEWQSKRTVVEEAADAVLRENLVNSNGGS